ncbi:MAG: hypothetical protein ACP5H2_11085 [Solirubrobacteraceae bacterium]
MSHRPLRAMVVVVVVATGSVLAATVTARSGRSSTRSNTSATVAAREALALWRGFPASANPRPIVVVGEGSVLDPALGFPNSADKIAWIAAHFTLAVPLPTAKSTSDGYPVISAAAAYRLLRSMGGKQKYPVTTWLSVDKVRLGQAAFDTDRGPVKLPAWKFGLAGVKRPGAVLAVADPEIYTPPALRELTSGVGDSEDESAQCPRTESGSTSRSLAPRRATSPAMRPTPPPPSATTTRSPSSSP